MKCRSISVIVVSSMSPPSRGAWIEICEVAMEKMEEKVAPLAGGVD